MAVAAPAIAAAARSSRIMSHLYVRHDRLAFGKPNGSGVVIERFLRVDQCAVGSNGRVVYGCLTRPPQSTCSTPRKSSAPVSTLALTRAQTQHVVASRSDL